MQPLLNIAVRAARRAGDLIVRNVDRVPTLGVRSKSRNDFVTRGRSPRRARHHRDDPRVRIRITGFSARKPGAAAATSSSGSSTRSTARPTSCTGSRVFAVSLAVEHRGRLEHGVVYDPMRQELFTASRGDGAQLDGKRIRVSKQTALEGALVGTGFPYRSNMRMDDYYMAMLRAVMEQTAGIRRPGAAALDLAYVAAGRLDAFWEIGLNAWDTAAGTLLITEAGGRVGTLTGGEFRQRGNIIAGTPKVYEAMIECLGPHVPASLRERRHAARADVRAPGLTSSGMSPQPRCCSRLAPSRPERSEHAGAERRDDDAERRQVRHVIVVDQHHLHADEGQDQDQAVLQVAEHRHQAGDSEVQGAQPQDRERVRREHQEGIAGHGQDRRNRIDREHDVGDVDDDQRDEQRRGVQAAVLAYQELRGRDLRRSRA